jgi:D-lactate dehydrogenase (cytochrome)
LGSTVGLKSDPLSIAVEVCSPKLASAEGGYLSEIVRWAIGVGGVAAGSHGVGIGKRKFMALQHGDSLEIMKQIKCLFDPNGILNPGKIF